MSIFKTKYNDLNKALIALRSQQSILDKNGYDFDKASKDFFSDENFCSECIRLGRANLISESLLDNEAFVLRHKDSLSFSSISKRLRNDLSFREEFFRNADHYIWNRNIPEKIKAIDYKFSSCVFLPFSQSFADCANEWCYILPNGKTSETSDNKNSSFLEEKLDYALIYTSGMHTRNEEWPYSVNYFPSEQIFSYNIAAPWVKGGGLVAKPIASLIKEKNIKFEEFHVASLIFIDRPQLLKENPNKISSLRCPDKLERDWPGLTSPRKISDEKYLREFLLPCIDNLLCGKKVAIMAIDGEKTTALHILQDALFCLPADIARKYSFCTELNEEYFDRRIYSRRELAITSEINFDIAVTSLIKDKAMLGNWFVVEAKCGCKNYEPKTELSRQILNQFKQKNIAKHDDNSRIK